MNFQRKVQRAVRHSKINFTWRRRHLTCSRKSLTRSSQSITRLGTKKRDEHQLFLRDSHFRWRLARWRYWHCADCGAEPTRCLSLFLSRCCCCVCVILIYVLRRSESARPACDCGKITLRASSTVQHARRRQPHACTHGWTRGRLRLAPPTFDCAGIHDYSVIRAVNHGLIRFHAERTAVYN